MHKPLTPGIILTQSSRNITIEVQKGKRKKYFNFFFLFCMWVNTSSSNDTVIIKLLASSQPHVIVAM